MNDSMILNVLYFGLIATAVALPMLVSALQSRAKPVPVKARSRR